MSTELSTIEKEIKTKELFLNIFQEKGVSIEELKEAICQSYIDEGFDCKTFDDIPIEEMQTAILDCYEAGGLSFKNMDEVFAHDFDEED
ncbi:hypothetical protein CLPUN_35920 [Clostridium puniceum]|uniref:Uncharacterized protein n=1 Tax=Clostridium puniceum TaxID=29367 RepID=A0A1S8TB32_9CLOT|nr:hypothetical protein [Clostridium puniceum]OOM74963.1 hypothetical protein CLPUN_35920 [Clostridium puniceum]